MPERLPEVEAQIEECLTLPWPDLRTRLAIRKRTTRGFIREEAIVYLCRLAHRQHDHVRLNGLWRALLTRIDRAAYKGLAVLASKQAKHEGVVAIGEALASLVFDLKTDRADFYQMRFRQPFQMLVLQELDRQIAAERRGDDEDALRSPDEDDNGEADKLEAEVARQRGRAPPDQATHLREHLAMIEDERHREAFVLRHRDGKTKEQIAVKMGVTERTVSNWLTTAQANLAAGLRGPDADAE